MLLSLCSCAFRDASEAARSALESEHQAWLVVEEETEEAMTQLRTQVGLKGWHKLNYSVFKEHVILIHMHHI